MHARTIESSDDLVAFCIECILLSNINFPSAPSVIFQLDSALAHRASRPIAILGGAIHPGSCPASGVSWQMLDYLRASEISSLDFG